MASLRRELSNPERSCCQSPLRLPLHFHVAPAGRKLDSIVPAISHPRGDPLRKLHFRDFDILHLLHFGGVTPANQLPFNEPAQSFREKLLMSLDVQSFAQDTDGPLFQVVTPGTGSETRDPGYLLPSSVAPFDDDDGVFPQHALEGRGLTGLCQRWSSFYAIQEASTMLGLHIPWDATTFEIGNVTDEMTVAPPISCGLEGYPGELAAAEVHHGSGAIHPSRGSSFATENPQLPVTNTPQPASTSVGGAVLSAAYSGSTVGYATHRCLWKLQTGHTAEDQSMEARMMS
ncbi:hypothetical protein BU15DRAFT_59997 [Melanogaster broomeanus]|nr:hypothetical protein BU15DRAFT_59997 [Melanogaster broomeanus]